jgi:hypothetical protein
MGALVEFTGGGSLDGAVLEQPPAPDAVTIDGNGRSWYVRSATGIYEFAGYGETGEVMSGFMREFSAAAKAEREAVEAAMRPVSCRSCGATYGSTGAYVVHFEFGEGSRCLSGDRAAQQHGQQDAVRTLPPGRRGQSWQRSAARSATPSFCRCGSACSSWNGRADGAD